jgi:hypothetical protein
MMKKILRFLLAILLIKLVFSFTKLPVSLNAIKVFTIDIIETKKIIFYLPMLLGHVFHNILLLAILAIGFIKLLINKRLELNKWITIGVFLNTFYFVITLMNYLPILYQTKNFVEGKFLIYECILSPIIIILYALYYSHLTDNDIDNEKEDVSNIIKIRFKNYVIDFLIVILISFSYQYPLSIFGRIFGFEYTVLLFLFVYYFFLELFFHQTIGKVITATYVQCKNGTFRSILIRTLSRHIPFEPFSYVMGKQKKWHDLFSKTKIMRYKY